MFPKYACIFMFFNTVSDVVTYSQNITAEDIYWIHLLKNKFDYFEVLRKYKYWILRIYYIFKAYCYIFRYKIKSFNADSDFSRKSPCFVFCCHTWTIMAHLKWHEITLNLNALPLRYLVNCVFLFLVSQSGQFGA